MAAALAHRGPDAEGFLDEGPVALGHRRLSIIDLRPDANQPIASEDGSVVAVVNGEIYNFAELRRALEQRGHCFRSRSDSEVIVHLYEDLGEDCVTPLRGMFAFAVWDRRARRLLLARDRVGKKPLVYAARADGFWFASELQALIAALPERPAVDLDALDQYLTLQYVPAPLTAFEGVCKLPPAHTLTVSPGQVPRLQRYWRLSFAPGPPVAAEDATLEVRSLMEEAVKLRTVSDVPLGAFLSGGIDSSAVVALLARQASGPVRTFSIDFPEADTGETRYARMVAERYGTRHEELTVSPDMVAVLPEIVRRYGEPFADESAVPVYYLSQMTRRHVVVALSGDGGDEAFAGYQRYALEKLARLLQRVPAPGPRLLSALLARLPGAALWPAREFGRLLEAPVTERYFLLLGHFTRADKERVLGPALLERARKDQAGRSFAELLQTSDAEDEVNRFLDLDTQTYLPDDILTKVDIASMAHALEVRAPFVDHVLLERLARLPGSLKLRGFRGKHIMRRAVRDLLPPPILRRFKRGFGLPLGRWLREDLHDLSQDLLTDGTARARGLVDTSKVSRLLEEHRSGVDHGDRLWSLLVLELWHRLVVDQRVPVAASSTPPAPPAG